MSKLKWQQYYATEDDLINAMMEVNPIVFEKLCLYQLKGYDYLQGFQNYYKKYNKLSDKQIYTLKKILAEQIYLYHNNGFTKDGKYYYEIGLNGATKQPLYHIINI